MRVRPARSVWLLAPLALFAGLLLFPSEAAFGAPQQPGSRPSETDLDRAEALVSRGSLDEAISLLENLQQKKPTPSGIEAKLGKAYYKKRSFQQAIAHLKAALQENPDDRETVQLLGLSFYTVGQFDQAIPLLEKIQSRLPATEFDGWYLLGVCYLRTQQPEKARAAFAQMFSVPPDSAAGHLLFAQMMVRQRLEEEAVPELEKSISLDPRLPMVHFLLGEIYLYKTNPQRALEEFRRELAINPTVWLVYWRLGDAYARLEKYDEAERALKQSIWLNESFTGSYVLLGEVELKKGNLELGAGFLERALKLDPKNDYAHYSLARVYQQMGRIQEANRHFEITRSLRAEKKSDEQRLFQDITR
jgi:tetratricopeptide (TPR) repeat protein